MINNIWGDPVSSLDIEEAMEIAYASHDKTWERLYRSMTGKYILQFAPMYNDDIVCRFLSPKEAALFIAQWGGKEYAPELSKYFSDSARSQA